MRALKSMIATQERVDWFCQPKTFLVFAFIIATGMYMAFTGLHQYGDVLLAYGYVIGAIVIVLALLFVPPKPKLEGAKPNFIDRHVARFVSAEQRLLARPPLI